MPVLSNHHNLFILRQCYDVHPINCIEYEKIVSLSGSWRFPVFRIQCEYAKIANEFTPARFPWLYAHALLIRYIEAGKNIACLKISNAYVPAQHY